MVRATKKAASAKSAAVMVKKPRPKIITLTSKKKAKGNNNFAFDYACTAILCYFGLDTFWDLPPVNKISRIHVQLSRKKVDDSWSRFTTGWSNCHIKANGQPEEYLTYAAREIMESHGIDSSKPFYAKLWYE